MKKTKPRRNETMHGGILALLFICSSPRDFLWPHMTGGREIQNYEQYLRRLAGFCCAIHFYTPYTIYTRRLHLTNSLFTSNEERSSVVQFQYSVSSQSSTKKNIKAGGKIWKICEKKEPKQQNFYNHKSEESERKKTESELWRIIAGPLQQERSLSVCRMESQ